MGAIKQKIRNIRYGTVIRSALISGEKMMFQNVMSCSTNRGKWWCGAIVGLTNKRVLIEWQRSKGQDVAISYDQIINWQIGSEIGGISEIVNKLLPLKFLRVDICVNEQLTIRIINKNSIMEIFINQLKKLCPEKQR